MRYWEYQKRASYPENSNDLSTEVTDIILQSPKYNKVDVLVNRRGPYKKAYIGASVLHANDDVKATFSC